MCDMTSCPRANRCVPKLTPGLDPRMVDLCVCDPGADELAALVAEGVGQREASLRLWAPELLADETKEAS